jgi:hypothetical protein
VCLMPILACAHIDPTNRPNATVPACLFVTSLPWSWQSNHVADVAADWNKDLGRRVLGVAPDCQPGDFWIPMAFVRKLPPECGTRGCTRSQTINGRPFWREVFVHEDAPISTVWHELGHVVGCNHDDMSSPCNGW